MTRKTFFSIIILFFMTASSFAQPLNLDGFVFEERNGKSVALVPFATIFYYNYEDTTRLEFCSLSNMFGKYNIYNLRTGKYVVKITASGFKTKRQEIQFRDAQKLAQNTNGIVHAQIGLQRLSNVQVTPVVYLAKDLLKLENETVAEIMNRLKVMIKSSNKNSYKYKTYRILIGNMELQSRDYQEMKAESFKDLAKSFGDKNLSKTYIEYYNLSENKTLADGIFNIVFNGITQKPDLDYVSKYTETKDFFIK